MMKRCAVSVLVVTLAGCAQHTWAPGPGLTEADFEPAKARCSIMARHGGGGFAAYGSPSYVAGAAIGNAIAESIRAQQDFNDCMEAGGWQIADQTHEQHAQSADVKDKVVQLVGEKKSCVSTVRDNPEYSPIIGHFSDPVTGKYSMLQLADTSAPTPDESRLMASYYDQTMACSRTMADAITQLVPAAAPILQKAMAEHEQITKLLVTRQITWGDFASKTEERNSTTTAELHAVRF